MNNAGNWRSNRQLLKGSSYILTGGIIYSSTVIAINSIFNLRAFNIYSICLEKDEAKNNNPILVLIFIMLPLMTLICVTCTMDFTCLIWLANRTRVNPDPDNDTNVGCINVMDEIPLRATMINTLLLIPYILSSVAISKSNITPMEKYLIATLSYRFNDIIRSPLIVTCTFKVNNDNRARHREIRRQKEIQAALKRRWERRLQNPTLWIEMEDIELSTDQVILEEASTYVQPSVGLEMPMVLQVPDDDMIVPDRGANDPQVAQKVTNELLLGIDSLLVLPNPHSDKALKKMLYGVQVLPVKKKIPNSRSGVVYHSMCT